MNLIVTIGSRLKLSRRDAKRRSDSRVSGDQHILEQGNDRQRTPNSVRLRHFAR